MKSLVLSLTLVLTTAVVLAQKNAPSYQLSLGDEIKLKKGTGDLDIISADNAGLYFSEQRTNRTMFNASPGYKLYKLDKNFGEVYDKDYKRELKGLSFQSFQALGDDIFLFATDYERKRKQFTVYGAKVDKSTGDLTSDFSELGNYELETKKDDYDMKVTPIQQGRAFLMVSNISAKDRVSIGVALLDNKLKKKENAVINLAFEPKQYQLADVQYTMNNKIILLGKMYEEVQVGKKKKKRLVFTRYTMSIYNNRGDKEKEVQLDVNNRYVISGKLIEQPTGELLLAGFYSNDSRKEDINGFFITKVDPDKGVLTTSSIKEINTGMLGKANEDDAGDDDEPGNKKQKKKQDDDDVEEFPNSYIIKSVDINPTDGSIMISSEIAKYSLYIRTTTSYDASSHRSTTNTTYIHTFINQDILLINADKNGNIKWLNAIPKSQKEKIVTANPVGDWGYSVDQYGYFSPGLGMPFYSSFKSLIYNNQLIILMNDHVSNNVNPAYGDRVKMVTNFRTRSNVYGLAVDLATGNIVRKMIGSNNDETVLMPRHAYINGNQLLVPSWRQRTLGKTELRFARITIK